MVAHRGRGSDVVHLIVELPSGGRLYQGSLWAVRLLSAHDGISLVVLAAAEHQRKVKWTPFFGPERKVVTVGACSEGTDR